MPTHPRFDEFISLFDVRRSKQNQYTCVCPAHDDNQASLCITEGDKGIVLHCQAGCSVADVLGAVGWVERDLFYPNEEHQNSNPQRTRTRTPGKAKPKAEPVTDATPELKPWERIEATYPYADAAGVIKYCSFRLHSPKSFRQAQPDPNDPSRYIWNMDGVTPLPYQLPRLLMAIRENLPIYIVEGEKDVASLRDIGLVATTNHGGAGKWTDAHSKWLAGADVIIIPDNDVPGCDHAMQVACSVSQYASSVRYLLLHTIPPGLPPKADVSDWLAVDDNNGEKLAAWVKIAAQRWFPGCIIEPSDEAIAQHKESKHSKFAPITPPSKLPPNEFMLTDYGNAERLVHAHGANLRYNVDRGQWLYWDGVLWQEDSIGHVQRFAIEVIRSIYDDVAALYSEMKNCSTPDERKLLDQRANALQKHAIASEARSRLDAMINLAQNCEGIPIRMAELNPDPWLFCCLNGIIDLRNGELLEPAQHNLITKQVHVNYDADATCPRWLSFLEEIMPNPEMRDYLQRAVGYTLSGDVSEQCLFFLFGGGRNGKSTFLEIITDLLGDYFQKASAEMIMIKKYGGGIPNDIAMLAGSRFVLVSELAGRHHLNESLVKDLTGGDSISARFLHQEFFSFRAGFKLWMYGNAKPRVQEKSEGIWRRIRLIPFTVEIPSWRVDGHLKSKLREELPGILNWAIQGCLQWRRDGLSEPQEIQDAVNDYRQQEDLLADFLEACCVLNHDSRVTKKELFASYKTWAENCGEQVYDTARRFNNDIRSRSGIKDCRGHANVPCWQGIRLKSYEEANCGEQTQNELYANTDDDVAWA